VQHSSARRHTHALSDEDMQKWESVRTVSAKVHALVCERDVPAMCASKVANE
jgi:hypothetical protein